MALKIDQGAMAQEAHDKNLQARKDGGPGSGPHQGGSAEIKRRKENVAHAERTRKAVKEGKNVSEEDKKRWGLQEASTPQERAMEKHFAKQKKLKG